MTYTFLLLLIFLLFVIAWHLNLLVSLEKEWLGVGETVLDKFSFGVFWVLLYFFHLFFHYL